MGSVKTVSAFGLMSLLPLLAFGAQPAALSVAAGAPTNELGVWVGNGAAFDADMNLIETYQLKVVNKKLDDTQTLSQITATPQAGTPLVATCLITSAGLKRTTRCNNGTGEQVVIGSMVQTTFHVDDGSTLESSAAIDDGGERQRIIRRHFNAEQVLTYNRESLQRVQ
jgi:hypothetical protein